MLDREFVVVVCQQNIFCILMYFSHRASFSNSTTQCKKIVFILARNFLKASHIFPSSSDLWCGMTLGKFSHGSP